MKKITKHWNGVKYTNYTLEGKEIAGTISIDNHRKTYKGKLNVCITEGSVKYPRELQIQLWYEDVPEKSVRIHKSFNRLEIYMPLKEGVKFLEYVLEDVKKHECV